MPADSIDATWMGCELYRYYTKRLADRSDTVSDDFDSETRTSAHLCQTRPSRGLGYRPFPGIILD
jgi:hypothetical protein